MAVDYDPPPVTYGGIDPDPVEFVNDTLIPTLGDIDSRLGVLEGMGSGIPALIQTPKSGWWMVPGPGPSGWGTGPYSYASGSDRPCPVPIGSAVPIDRICAVVNVAEAVNARVLLYAPDARGYPSTLVAHGTFSCSTTGVKEVILGSPVDLEPGLHWGFLRSDGGTTVRFLGQNLVTFPILRPTEIATNSGGFSMLANPGTYASPAATISSWGYDDPNQGAYPVPLVGVRGL